MKQNPFLMTIIFWECSHFFGNVPKFPTFMLWINFE